MRKTQIRIELRKCRTLAEADKVLGLHFTQEQLHDGDPVVQELAQFAAELIDARETAYFDRYYATILRLGGYRPGYEPSGFRYSWQDQSGYTYEVARRQDGRLSPVRDAKTDWDCQF